MIRLLVAAGCVAGLPASAVGAQARIQAQAQAQKPVRGARVEYDWRSQILSPRPRTTASPGMTIAVAGDMIYSLPMLARRDSGLEAVAGIVRGADVAITNQEGSIIDLDSFAGYPEAQNGGGYPVGPPALARDIAGLGFDIAAKANNHAVDFGAAGLLESRRHLEAAGVRAPGAGRNRADARAAVLVDTPRGRVAVIAAASTFPGSAPAGEGAGISADRPGISAMRTRRIVVAPPATMRALRALVRATEGATAALAPEVEVGTQRFREGPVAGVTYEMDEVDRFEILRTVRGAKNVADAAVFTIHAHENAGLGDDRIPADFQQRLYHDVIDAGGDIVFVHGPHVTRGIEIYRGRPIFYGLGHFTVQMLGMAPVMREDFEAEHRDPRFVATGDADLSPLDPAEFDGILAVTTFGVAGEVEKVMLYPLDLRAEAPMADRGIPRLATGARAADILRRLDTDSRPYGTRLAIEDGVGVIHLAPGGPSVADRGTAR